MTPAALPGHPFRVSYGAADDRLHDFYIPALDRSVRFDRATGFFSSAPRLLESVPEEEVQIIAELVEVLD